MINVDAVSDQLAPMGNPFFVDDQIERIGSVPGIEQKMFVEIFALRGFIALKKTGRLPDNEKFFLQIETKAAPIAQRAFENDFAAAAEPWVQVFGDFGQRKKRRHSRATFDQATARGHHGREGENKRDFSELPDGEEGADRADEKRYDRELGQRT